MKRVLFVVVLSIAVVAALWLGKGEGGQSVRENHRSAEPRAAGVKKKVGGPAVSRVATSQDEPEESADTAEDRSVTLHGRVVDAHAEPVDGAAVSIDSVPPRALRVSKDGAFAFEGLARRTYRLLARSSDGMAATRQLSVDAETPEVELVLEPAAALEIAVHGALDARPIAGVRVRVDEDPNVEGTTDAEGRLTLEGMVRGRHVVTASRDGYAPARAVVFEDRASGTRQLTLRLHPGISVHGTVMTSAGVPIANASVRALRPSALSAEEAHAGEAVRSDQDGTFRIPALPPGVFRVSAQHEEWTATTLPTVQLEAGAREAGPLSIVMQRGCVLEGQVFQASGSPAPHALVSVRPAGTAALLGARRSALTDSEGFFELRGLPAGEVWVEARLDASVAAAQLVDVSGGTAQVSLLLESAGLIRGVVYSTGDEPLAGAQVAAIPEDGDRRVGLGDSRVGHYASDVSDAAGQFQLSGLLPGRYRLRASLTHAVDTPNFWMAHSAVAETGDMDVRLVVERTARVRAEVALADGSSPDVFTARLSLAPPVTFESTGGTLVLEDVPPGNHVVSVAAPGFPPHETSVSVSPGEERDLGRIVLESGLSVTGRVVDAEGSPAPGVRVSAGSTLTGDGRGPQQASAFALTDGGGGFAFDGVKPGPMVLMAEDGELGRSTPEVVQVGRELPPVTLELQPVSPLRGLVTRHGKPVHGAAVVAAPGGSSTVRLAVPTQADGRFQFDRLSRGPHVVTAGLRLSPTLQVAHRVSVVVGDEEDLVTIDASAEGPEVIVAMPETEAAPLAQVHLITGEVRASTLSELEQVVSRQSPGLSWVGLSLEGRPLVLPGVAPGSYSLCTAIIRQKLEDPAVQYRIHADAGATPVRCDPVLVTNLEGQTLMAQVVG